MNSKQKSLKVLFAILLISPLFSLQAKCDNKIAEIVHGSKVEVPHPATVVVWIYVKGDPNALGYCTGTFISPTRVLTAAHCVSEGPVTVQMGETPHENEVKALKTFVPSKYKSQQARDMDVGIIVLPAQQIEPASLLRGSPVKNGDEATIYGYGVDENDKDYLDRESKSLLETRVKTKRFTEKRYKRTLFYSRYRTTRTGACHGDSGAAVYKATQSGELGIVGTVFGGGDINKHTDSCVGNGVIGIYIDLQSSEVQRFLRRNAPDASYVQ